MANKEQYLSRDGVSHLYLLIKNKLTTYFKTLFVAKKDGYDLSQNDFTNELKNKLENMDGSGGGVVIAEDEIIVITATMTSETTVVFDEETATLISSYNGAKPLFMKVEPVGLYAPYVGGYLFGGLQGTSALTITVDTSTRSGTIEISSLFLKSNLKNEDDGSFGNQTVFTTMAIKNLLGQPNFFASLDNNGKVQSSQLPSYVDDIVEGYLGDDNLFYEDFHGNNLIKGEKAKIYFDLSTDTSYRWSGSQYVKLESSTGLTALTNTEIDEIITSVDNSTE